MLALGASSFLRGPVLFVRIDNNEARPHLKVLERYKMPTVEVYTKAFCPYCARAKALLAAKGVTFEEYDITMDKALRAAMIERAQGRSTVPQVFVNDTHIGGSDDLAAAASSGKLDRLLAT